MNQRTISAVNTLAGLILLGTAQTAASTDVAAVIECMQANIPQTVRIQTVEVSTFDRAGNERVLKGRIFGTREKQRIRIMARLDHPKPLAGAAILVREADSTEEMYLYLPATNRVKRLAGAAVGGRLWGTDFSYDEFKQVYGAFAGGLATLDGTADLAGRPAHVLTFSPRADDQSPYDRIRLHVDQQTCVVVGADFLRGETARKRLTAPAAQIRQFGKKWYPSEMQLEDLMEGTRTRVVVTGVNAEDRLSASYFSPQLFYSVH